MKTDQDLIFEAYAKTLNEGSHLYGDTELGPGKYKASDVTITDYDIEGLTRDGVGGGYENVPVEFEDDNGTTMTGIVDYLYVDYDQVDGSGDIHDAEVGTLEEDDNEGRAKNIQRGQEAISAAQEEYYKQFGAEAFEDHYGFPYPHAEDNENYASEGAVNLLEQLKEEVPELEDKIDQILEKVFDAVDILKQEPYAYDPQLVKAHDSLIEGDY